MTPVASSRERRQQIGLLGLIATVTARGDHGPRRCLSRVPLTRSHATRPDPAAWAVIPGGLGEGSVSDRVEATHRLASGVTLAVVEQLYSDAGGRPRDARARHTQTYVLTPGEALPRILPGQNTVTVAGLGG